MRAPAAVVLLACASLAAVEALHGALRPAPRPSAPAPRTREARALEARLMREVRRASLAHGLLEDRDHVMVCVSGGKDSATLLHLLLRLRDRLSKAISFRITAVHLDQGHPGYDGAPLRNWLAGLGCAYRIVKEDTYSVVKAKSTPDKTYCALCSRLRRGVLASVARDLGATKLALGHHADDAVETLLLNMLYQGQLKAMPARYRMTFRRRRAPRAEGDGVDVVRPLITCAEADIAAFSQHMAFPILPCTLCGSQPDSQRQKVKLLCTALEGLNPHARRNMLAATADVRPTHLLDVGLREACGLDPRNGVAREARATLVRGGLLPGDTMADGRQEDDASGGGKGSAEDGHGQLVLGDGRGLYTVVDARDELDPRRACIPPEAEGGVVR